MNDFLLKPQETSLPVAFTPDERRRLLEDIGFLCLSVNQATELKTSAPANVAHSESLIAAHSPFVRLQRLEQFVTRIVPLLLAAAKQPDAVLVSALRRLPLDQLRGDAATINEFTRSPKAQQALIQPRNPLPLLAESYTVISFATPANRLIAMLLRQLSAEANSLALLAAFCADANAETQARTLENRVKSLLAQDLWREQKPIPLGQIALLLPVQRAKASLPYRLILDHWQRFRAEFAGFDWSGLAALTLSERALWQIYEIWCFLHIVQALQGLGWSLIGETQIQIIADGMHLVPATGQASCLSFMLPNAPRKSKKSMLELFYQPLFVSANRQLTRETLNEDRYVSRSHAMQPDFVIKHQRHLVVFDAKLRSYSTFGSEQDDIDKMHAYRDGIVRRAGQSVRPAVSAAWCLFPGLSNTEELSGIRAYPAPTKAAPFGNGDIGAIQLRPLDRGSQETLRKLLTMLP